ncbi:hypothetical protein [Micromonospora sp. NPDC092111]|uniref:hypothetical protein n=1 Tax=Micromonospora sp. NPDC092111 TaxID=3364289 RepID=UPI003822CBD9
MRRLRALAEHTPAGRERYVDLLRALAISMVVLGHAKVTGIGRDAAGRPTDHCTPADLPGAYPLTWLAQVRPEPLGTPVPALVAYLAGAGVLRPLRSGWGSRG